MIHHKGPWHVEGLSSGYELCDSVEGESGHIAIFPDTGEADARLCAAAPDLLAACEAALPALDRAALELGGTGYFASKADELCAAIARTRGESWPLPHRTRGTDAPLDDETMTPKQQCGRCGGSGLIDVSDGYVVSHQADCPDCRSAATREGKTMTREEFVRLGQLLADERKKSHRLRTVNADLLAACEAVLNGFRYEKGRPVMAEWKMKELLADAIARARGES